ncbi:Hypothetical protein HVR_LOCUS1140 [uncultured virus]|nr:Hypothetical protein HVR_LOCUS1140 [uncultured virus]
MNHGREIEQSSILKEYKKIVSVVEDELRDLLKNHDVGGHGMDHMLAVASHTEKALEHELLPKHTKLQVYLAALLHDADDPKIFKNSNNYNNARDILERSITLSNTRGFYYLEYNKCSECLDHVDLYRNTYINSIISMIDLVSCSKNGDSDPPVPWMAIPRDSDRLEAAGEIGIERCLQVTKHFGSPHHTPDTPRVYTEEELWKVATPERFTNYKKSVSMIDHYYDKLLHIVAPERLKSKNVYILKEAERRNKIMIDYVLNYWNSESK